MGHPDMGGEVVKRSDKKNRQDFYFNKAKAEKYRARSVYKLKEIQERFRVLSKGNIVVDLGAAPGSWSQYAAEQVGPSGRVVAIDRQPIRGPLKENVQQIQMDVLATPPLELLAAAEIVKADIVLSDMAPRTSGVRLVDHMRSIALSQAALRVAEEILTPGGAWVCKVFQGEDLEAFFREVKARFKKVNRFKPQASRNESMEIFLVGQGFERKRPLEEDQEDNQGDRADQDQ